MLLAVCDADYNFLFVDIGTPGSNNDCGIFNSSVLGKRLEAGQVSLQPPSKLPGLQNVKFPYVFVGDDAFPLKTYMMKPYAASGRHFDFSEVF